MRVIKQLGVFVLYLFYFSINVFARGDIWLYDMKDAHKPQCRLQIEILPLSPSLLLEEVLDKLETGFRTIFLMKSDSSSWAMVDSVEKRVEDGKGYFSFVLDLPCQMLYYILEEKNIEAYRVYEEWSLWFPLRWLFWVMQLGFLGNFVWHCFKYVSCFSYRNDFVFE